MDEWYVIPGPGQESVWDYPRPPRVEPSSRHIEVVFDEVLIADTCRALRVIETSHPPVYYVPPEDIRLDYLQASDHVSYCQFKGIARYYHVVVNDRTARNAAWHYPAPMPGYESIRDHVAFYAGKMDTCFVDGEQVVPQKSEYFGGWITSDVVGPFKGGPGTVGW